MPTPAIKKILFPVDFSRSSRGAARYVEEMAGRFEACIRLLHVVGPGEHNLAAELLPRRREDLEAFLAEELKCFNAQRFCMIGDDPARTIEEVAKSWPADLVMMPTHGLGAFRRMLLGSVTTKVLHDLDCPVWTGVHAREAPPLEQIRYRSVLCAVDLGPRSEAILRWANWFAAEHAANLIVVNASSPIPALTTANESADTLLATTIDIAEEGVAALKAKLDLNCPSIVRFGDPAAIVSAAAEDYRADLLIIGRHSGEGLLGRLMEHAYTIIRRAPCPVISI
jgi:nucleotide-binding universal stress UspA family protein